MKIVNKTDHSDREVAKIVKWVFAELDVAPGYKLVTVAYHNGDWYGSGRAWYDKILCKIGREGTYPVASHVYKRKADMPEPWLCENWQQALVSITAHEAMHLRQQHQRRVGRRKRRQRGKEQECEYAAYRLWRRWCQREARRQAKEQKCAVSSSPSNSTHQGTSKRSSSESYSSSHHSQLTITGV